MIKNKSAGSITEKLLGNLGRERVRPPKAHTINQSVVGSETVDELKIGLVQKNCASLEDCDDGVVRSQHVINNDRKLHMEGAWRIF